jgi:hypothetical protein
MELVEDEHLAMALVGSERGETHDLVDARPADAGRLRAKFFEILDDDLDALRSWR